MKEKALTPMSLMNPTLNALRHLGGSGSINEIYEKVAELENIGENTLEPFFSQNKVACKLAWARTYLKKYGFLENPSKGLWTLTQKAKEQTSVEPSEILEHYKSELRILQSTNRRNVNVSSTIPNTNAVSKVFEDTSVIGTTTYRIETIIEGPALAEFKIKISIQKGKRDIYDSRNR